MVNLVLKFHHSIDKQIALISHAIKVMLKNFHMLAIVYSKPFKLGFSSTWTESFQMYKLDLEKAEEPDFKLSTSFVS